MRLIVPRVPSGVAWAVPAACAALVSGALLLEVRSRSGLLGNPEYLANAPLSLGFSVVGALVVSRRPGERLGWLYLGTAAAMAATLFVYEYAYLGLVTEPGTLPGALMAGWISSWVWALGFAPLFTAGLLLYPDSRLPSPRWRWALVVSAVAVLCLAARPALSPGPLVNHPGTDNPLGIDGVGPALRVIGTIGYPLMLVGFAAGVAALVVRWRRAPAGGVRRRQISMLMMLAGIICLALLGEPLFGTDSPGPADILAVVVLAMVPVAVGLAILRHHLYDIDVALNRSLVYAGLTACVIALYATVVWMLGHQLSSETSVSVVATGVVAALVLPLRTWLQRTVDRTMYGDRGDPYAAVSRLAARLQGAAEPGESLRAVADAIAASLRLPYVAVQTVDGVEVGTGDLGGRQPVEVPLTHQGERVGRLVVCGRDHRPLPARDLALLADLARPAGAAVHAAGLADALRASRRGLVQAREDERRRLRRDLHDGLGPTLAGLGLGIDLAAGLIDRDPDGARRLLQDLKREAVDGVEEIRRLVYDLRPPALDELGLVAALRQQVGRVGVLHPGLEVHVEAPSPLPHLDAATEVAAYRIAMEALTNATRHSSARHCRIRVAADAGELRVEVADDGSGIPLGSRPGVGLAAMRERATEIGGECRVTQDAPVGTRVTATLPMATP